MSSIIDSIVGHGIVMLVRCTWLLCSCCKVLRTSHKLSCMFSMRFTSDRHALSGLGGFHVCSTCAGCSSWRIAQTFHLRIFMAGAAPQVAAIYTPGHLSTFTLHQYLSLQTCARLHAWRSDPTAPPPAASRACHQQLQMQCKLDQRCAGIYQLFSRE